ncbi:hypothetical protein V6N12_048137 [Hibiscus sabdariffa]|uniref:Protein kinase domain-containing protein n=1 Tax=Hibiscus sabdariffa TaxID=183260 RepID=A0ABR2EK53_9ROSI
MGLLFGVYLILMLNQILQAAEFQQGICGEEVCGNVTIPYPFGIHHNCYTLSWFRVTCEENKPFININGVNLELLGSAYINTIDINYPVTPFNCNHKPGITGDDVDLAGSPFTLLGSYNLFGSVGCGNLATISANRTYSIGGCVQSICGRKAGGSGPGCYTEIIGKLTSYTVSMVDMYGSKRSCTSAFMFSRSYFENGYPLPVEINGETTHVPVTLEWDPSFCGRSGQLLDINLIALLFTFFFSIQTLLRPRNLPCHFFFLCKRADCAAPRPKNLINEKACGKVSFEYPFGVTNHNRPKSRFEVICNETANGERTPFLNINGIHLQILGFSFLEGTVLVNHSATYFNCRGTSNNEMNLSLKGTPFYYSDIDNVFWSSGCGNLVTLFDERDGNLIGGCSQPSCRIRNETSPSAGCSIIFPRGLNSFFANISGGVDSSDYSSKRSCGIASMVYSREYYGLIDSPKDFNISDWSFVPTSLQWGAPKRGSCQLNQGSDISCSFDSQYCWENLNSTHLCVCAAKNIFNIGTYCQGCITSIVSISLLTATWQMRKAWKKRQNIKLKQKYFKRNGGLLLQKHLSGNKGNVEKIKLFTSKEMEKATDYYNKNRILGQGGQGTVYKGMLTDGSIVAVKKSRMLKGNHFDEKKVEQFINEVMILSQINHRNVVKLLGCCLEAEVPLLVYEFIQNGTLYDLIHYQTDEYPLTWEMRLRIAIEIANALFYLHSAASVPIYHRDIKSSNILLDDKYRAKVSDFGTSRSIEPEQTHLTTRVQGTFGYMDPEYFRSNQFTEKSDVYSFGVVLVELLTGRKPVLSDQSEEARSLVSYFLLSMQQDSLFNILDSTMVNDNPEEIIAMAKLARRCLNLNGKKRPTMKQVAMELELIKTSKASVSIEEDGDEESETDDIIESWNDNHSWSTSISITTESTTLPLNPTF